MQPNILKSFKINQVQYIDKRKGETFLRTISSQFVSPENRGGSSVKCPHCKEIIKNAGALSQHIMWNHSQILSSLPPSNTVLNNFVTVLSTPHPMGTLSSDSLIQNLLTDVVVEDCIIHDSDNNDNGSSLLPHTAVDVIDLTIKEVPAVVLNAHQTQMIAAVCDGRRMNKGSRQRHGYSFKFKRSAIGVYDEYVSNNHPNAIDDTATQCGVPYSTCRKWLVEDTRNFITAGWLEEDDAAVKGNRMRRERNGVLRCDQGRFNVAEKLLMEEIRIRRIRGRRVSPRYITRRMLEFVRSVYLTLGNTLLPSGEEIPLELIDLAKVFTAGRSWRQRFYTRWNIVTRKRTNKKSLALTVRVAIWQAHHVALRLFLQTRDQQCSKFGQYAPCNRYNVDQIPLPFNYDASSTLEFKGTLSVVIKGCSTNDGDKRFCTLQLCCRPVVPEGETQPRIAVIFRGQGTVMNREKDKYDKRVDVYFQKKAWADRPTSKSWVEKTFASHIQSRKNLDGSLPKTLLFCDNLDSQVHEGFLSALHELDSSRYLLPPNETEMCQPIDAGVGAVIKVKIGQAQDEWLDVEGNLDAWEGDPNATYKLDASMRRILITQWVGTAWDQMTTDVAYKDTFRRCFELTGALICADGTDDNLIRPMRGLEYTVPASIIDLTIERIMEQQQNIGPDVDGDPEDENEETGNVQVVGEVVDTALDTEDANAVINLLLERPSAMDIISHTRYDNPATVNNAAVAAAGGGEEEKGMEEEVEKDENEEESWAMGLANADLQEGALEPILEASVSRPRIGKGVMFLILIDAEWELVRFHKSVNTVYQLFNVITNEWCESALISEHYGRTNASTSRWIQFKSTAGR